MFTFTQTISRVASRLNKDSNNTTVATRIKNHINDTCLEKWHAYTWSFRVREYPIVLSPRVTSGTMTATNASRTLTASGTPFISGTHEGAWIHFTGDTVQAWYRIITVGSTSTATIEPAYQGTSGASKVYELIKTDYLLPTELSDTHSISSTIDHSRWEPVPHFQSDYIDFPPRASGYPQMFSILRQSQTLSTYTTGTVTGTSGSATLTGSSTVWLANVVPGDEIVIGTTDTNTYRVYSVESDTSLTLYNKLTSSPSGLTYTISRQFGKILRIWPGSDNPYIIFIKGLRAYAPLINNTDCNELLNRYPHAVIEGAVWREAGSSPDPREDSLYMRSERMWGIAQGEDEKLFPQSNPFPIYNPR